MANLTYETLRRATAGQAVALRPITILQPGGGPGAKVFPPSYAVENRAEHRYAVEKRHTAKAPLPPSPHRSLVGDSENSTHSRSVRLATAWGQMPVVEQAPSDPACPRSISVSAYRISRRKATSSDLARLRWGGKRPNCLTPSLSMVHDPLALLQVEGENRCVRRHTVSACSKESISSTKQGVSDAGKCPKPHWWSVENRSCR